ncbi:hypothetical protein ACOSQ3_000818 [Xanthoceras sorbifolium]
MQKISYAENFGWWIVQARCFFFTSCIPPSLYHMGGTQPSILLYKSCFAALGLCQKQNQLKQKPLFSHVSSTTSPRNQRNS